MPLQASLPRSAVNVPGDFFYMAGFEVTLYGRIWMSAEEVERNIGAAGVDNMTVPQLRSYLREHWPRIKAELLA